MTISQRGAWSAAHDQHGAANALLDANDTTAFPGANGPDDDGLDDQHNDGGHANGGGDDMARVDAFERLMAQGFVFHKTPHGSTAYVKSVEALETEDVRYVVVADTTGKYAPISGEDRVLVASYDTTLAPLSLIEFPTLVAFVERLER